MNFNTGLPEANVEQMSNAELFQYLFKAELDSDMIPTDVLIKDEAIASTSTFPDPSSTSSSSSSSLSPTSSFTSFSTSSSPASASLSYSPSAPPPYQQLDQTQVLDLFANNPVATYPTLLPSTSFSYRQISADMPPSMPTSLNMAPLEQPQPLQRTQFLNLASPPTPAAAQQEQMSVWLQRFQQLQQIHHAQQHQLLSSTLFENNEAGKSNNNNNRSDSPDSLPSPASSSSSSGNKDKVIYPSPPMKDDMDMDSDSDSGPSHQDGSDPLKPSPSELKKMTSKERRQLRNKLSARNFRVRRKGITSIIFFKNSHKSQTKMSPPVVILFLFISSTNG